MSTFDLDAVRAEVEPFAFTLAGETFTMPSRASLRWSVWERLATATSTATLEELLGPEQFPKFRALDPTKAQLDALADAYFSYGDSSDPER